MASLGVYTVTVFPKLPDGTLYTDPASSAQFTVQFKDPCTLLTFSIDPSVFSAEPIPYTITDPEKLENILDTKVSPSEILPICPIDVEFRVLKRNLTPIDDITALSFDPINQVFRI